jgi:hypothetical protein
MGEQAIAYANSRIDLETGVCHFDVHDTPYVKLAPSHCEGEPRRGRPSVYNFVDVEVTETTIRSLEEFPKRKPLPLYCGKRRAIALDAGGGETTWTALYLHWHCDPERGGCGAKGREKTNVWNAHVNALGNVDRWNGCERCAPAERSRMIKREPMKVFAPMARESMGRR